MLKHALELREQRLGEEHLSTASSLNNLALLYYDEENYEEAKPLLRRALAIYEKRLGEKHSKTQMIRENYADLLQMMSKDVEAKKLEKEL